MGYEIRYRDRFGPWQGPSASFYFMIVFCCVFCVLLPGTIYLYIGTLKCRGSIIVYIHTYIYTYIRYIYIENFHTFCNPYIDKSIKGGAFWDHRYFRS